MIRGDLFRPLPHSAFVEVTLTPLRLWESDFAAWGRERPAWPSGLVEAVKVHKSQVEWACSVFADSPPPLSATRHLYSHPCWLLACLFLACLFVSLFVCLSVCLRLAVLVLVLLLLLFKLLQRLFLLFLLLLVWLVMLLLLGCCYCYSSCYGYFFYYSCCCWYCW